MRMRKFLVGLAVVVAASTAVGCVHPGIQDPQTKREATADQIVQGANTLENFAIKANSDGSLSDAISVRIVRVVVDIDTAAKDAPVGWQASALTLWHRAKSDLDKENLPQAAQQAIAIFDALIGGLEGGVR